MIVPNDGTRCQRRRAECRRRFVTLPRNHPDPVRGDCDCVRGRAACATRLGCLHLGCGGRLFTSKSPLVRRVAFLWQQAALALREEFAIGLNPARRFLCPPEGNLGTTWATHLIARRSSAARFGTSVADRVAGSSTASSNAPPPLAPTPPSRTAGPAHRFQFRFGLWLVDQLRSVPFVFPGQQTYKCFACRVKKA
jgi:hypothetical protein